MRMKRWLIIYDIRDPKRLRRVAKTVENYGIRVQKSVFETIADERTIEILRKQLTEIIEEEDFVVYFDICDTDWQKKRKYGPGKFEESEEKSYYIV